MCAPLRLLDGVLLDRSVRAAPTGRRRDTAPEASANRETVSLRGVARTRTRPTPPPRRRRGVPRAPRHDPTPRHRADTTAGSSHAVEEARIRTPKQTLGTCAACARRTAGYIENTKAIFSGDSEKVTVRPVDSPSRGASTSSSFEGALITFSAAGARRPVAAAQNASSSTAPATTSSLWRFCRASSLWRSFALRITSARFAVGCFLCSGTGCCSPRRLLRLIHAVIASFASHNVA